MSSEFPNAAGFHPNHDRVDILLTVLADEQRRQVLRYFEGADDSVASVETLTNSLVESGNRSDAQEETAIRLHHVTLPKLADAGLIEYDGRSQTIRSRASLRWEEALALIREQE